MTLANAAQQEERDHGDKQQHGENAGAAKPMPPTTIRAAAAEHVADEFTRAGGFRLLAVAVMG